MIFYLTITYLHKLMNIFEACYYQGSLIGKPATANLTASDPAETDGKITQNVIPSPMFKDGMWSGWGSQWALEKCSLVLSMGGSITMPQRTPLQPMGLVLAQSVALDQVIVWKNVRLRKGSKNITRLENALTIFNSLSVPCPNILNFLIPQPQNNTKRIYFTILNE